MLFLHYPKCSTCRKAEEWLRDHDINVTTRHIVEQRPTAAELIAWQKSSELPWGRFLNTSGKRYRELNLAQKRTEMTEKELADLLATDGMLVKRPLLILDDGRVLTGFRVAEWEQALLK